MPRFSYLFLRTQLILSFVRPINVSTDRIYQVAAASRFLPSNFCHYGIIKCRVHRERLVQLNVRRSIVKLPKSVPINVVTVFVSCKLVKLIISWIRLWSVAHVLDLLSRFSDTDSLTFHNSTWSYTIVSYYSIIANHLCVTTIFLSHLWQSIRNKPQNRINRSVVLSNIHERVSNSNTTRYRDRVDACLEAFYKSVYNTEMGGMPTNVLFTATGTVFNLFSLGRPRRGRSLSSEKALFYH